MSPWQVLALTLAVTLFAYAAELVRRRWHQRALRRLAADWRMTFAQTDTLRLTPKVARHFPIPGAANLHVVNVIYGSDADRYRYVFTAEYTVGVVNAKRRNVRVASLTEPRDRARGAAAAGAAPTSVVLAPAELSLLEQYRHMAPAGSEPARTPAPAAAE
jgi:hypothetical protein